MSKSKNTSTNKKPKLRNRKAKDTVFCNLFSDKKYLLKLYQALHPEDKDIKESDLDIITLKNILTNQIYNDLSFRKKDKLIIFLEAQSTWTMNILWRMILYIAETLQRYFMDNKIDLYSATKVSVPVFEFYVLFTGNRKHKPKTIKLSEEFFAGKKIDFDITINMLYGEDESDIIGQYTAFTKIYDSLMKKYNPQTSDEVREVILETIKICKDRNLLKEYLESRESEVIGIMMTLFDEDTIQEMFIANQRREAAEEADRKVRNELNFIIENERKKADELKIEINAERKKAENERKKAENERKKAENGILSLVSMCKEFALSYSDTIQRVMKAYSLEEPEAKEYVDRFWK